MSRDDSLDDVLAAARAASAARRVPEWRDRVAALGADAIEAMTEWLEEPDLSAFAIRVIEATARYGERDAAIAALSSAFRMPLRSTIRGDIEDALARLRPGRAPSIPASGQRSIVLPEKAGWSWPGFRPSDFGNIKGTTWRRRSDPVALVPLVLRPLLELDSGFTTWPIYGSPEVHIADRDRYNQGGEWKQGWRASKLVVYAHGPTDERRDDVARVVAGWYLEKGTGEDDYGRVDPTLWDWPLFLDLLADERRRVRLEEATVKRGLRLGEYVGGRFLPQEASIGFVAAVEDGELVLRTREGSLLGRGWGELLQRTLALPEGTWHDFHIWREWPADVAIDLGQPFAHRELGPVMVDLASVYLDVIGRGRR